MRIGCVRRNSQVFERLYSFETIESFGHENDVRMQVRDQLQDWIDSAPHFGLFLRISRVVAEFGIADEMILQPKRVDGFRQTRRERHDTVDRLGNTNRAAGFIGNFPIGWGCRKDRRSALSMRQRRAEKQGCDGGQEGVSEARTYDFFHRSPPTRELQSATKKPHETAWGGWHGSFSRRARPSAAREGGLAYGFSADYSGGTAAESHGLPRYPCLQIEIRVYAAPTSMSTTSAKLANPSPPDRVANSPRALYSTGCGHGKVHDAGVRGGGSRGARRHDHNVVAKARDRADRHSQLHAHAPGLACAKSQFLRDHLAHELMGVRYDNLERA